jgi:hypothetical protein
MIISQRQGFAELGTSISSARDKIVVQANLSLQELGSCISSVPHKAIMGWSPYCLCNSQISLIFNNSQELHLKANGPRRPFLVFDIATAQ